MDNEASIGGGLPLRGEGRVAPRLAYLDLPPQVRARYPESRARFAGDAIAEREGLLPKLPGAPRAWQCAGVSKTTHQRCGGIATLAHLTCTFHGGRMPKGPAHPKFTHGGRSRFLPLRYHGLYEAALEDPDLGSLRRDLATTEVRLQDLLQRLDTGESSGAWAALHEELVPELARQIALGAPPPALMRHLERVRATVERGQALDATWQDVLKTQAHRAELVAREHKRLQDLGGVVSTEDLGVLLGLLMDRLQRIVRALMPEVQARQILGAFGQECQRALTGAAPKGLPAPATPREPGTRRHGEGYVRGQGAGA